MSGFCNIYYIYIYVTITTCTSKSDVSIRRFDDIYTSHKVEKVWENTMSDFDGFILLKLSVKYCYEQTIRNDR